MSVKVLKDEIIYNLDLYAKVYPNKDNSILCLANVQGDYDSLYFDSNKELNIAFKLIKSAFKENQTEDTVIDLDDLHNTLSQEVTIDQDELDKMFDKASDHIFVDNRRYDPPEHIEENEWPAEHQEPWPDPWPAIEEAEEHAEVEDAEEEVMADPFNNPDFGQPLGNLAEQFGGENAQDENPHFGWEDPHDLHLEAAEPGMHGIQFNDDMRDAIAGVTADRFNDQDVINNHLQNQIYENNQFVEEQVDRLERQNTNLQTQLAELQNMVYNNILPELRRER